LAVAMALKIAKEECEKRGEVWRPSCVIVYSGTNDALRKIEGGNYAVLEGRRIAKARLRAIETGLVRVHWLRSRGIEMDRRRVSNRGGG